MIKEVLQWVVAEMKTEGQTWAATVGAPEPDVVLGYPSWRRPPIDALQSGPLETPTIAILIPSVVLPGPPTGIGRTVGRRALQLEIYLFARHELELASWLDHLMDRGGWNERRAVANVNSSRVALLISEAGRFPNENGLQQEAHAFRLLLSISW